MVVDRIRQAGGERRPQRLHDAIAEQVGAGVVSGPDQPGRETERRREVGRAVIRGDVVESPVQRVAIAGDGSDDPGRRTDGDDRHSVLRPELVDQAVGLALRLGEP